MKKVLGKVSLLTLVMAGGLFIGQSASADTAYTIQNGDSFLPFVKSIKVFDEKYFESRNPNMEIILFWTKV